MARSKKKRKPQKVQKVVNTGRLLQQAMTQHKQGDLAAAQLAYQTILKNDPANGDVLHMLGLIAYQQGDNENALFLMKKASAILKNNVNLFINMGSVLNRLEHHQQAEECYEQALQLQPNSAVIYNNIGNNYYNQGRFTQAELAFQKALQINPANSEALNSLGCLLKEQGNYEQAERYFLSAIELKPEFYKAHVNLGSIYEMSKNAEQARKHLLFALELNPQSSSTYFMLGNLLFEDKAFDQAIEHYEKALQLSPEFTDALCNLGVLYRSKGDFDAAKQCFQRVIAIDPEHAEGYRSLMLLSKTEDSGSTIDDMLLSLKNVQPCSEEAMTLHFSLGAAYEKQGDFSESFMHYRQANTIKRSTYDYDLQFFVEGLEQIKQTFTTELIANNQDVGCASPVPIFVLGMPRSGTTLTEQILSSHPQVFGAGEIYDFNTAIDNIIPQVSEAGYPMAIQYFQPQHFKQLGDEYVEAIRCYAPDAQYIVNKLPANFIYVGLIRLALPQAKIVHCLRDPLDNCLSCYKILFAETQRYAYDLDELGQYYLLYQKTMAFWHQQFPNQIHDSQYETLISNFQPQVEQLLAYCGLPWDDACLHYYDNERFVRTASATQVREKIYDKSVGYWRNYQEQLQPLIKRLGQ